jgi:predicted alpha/beta hydrolase
MLTRWVLTRRCEVEGQRRITGPLTRRCTTSTFGISLPALQGSLPSLIMTETPPEVVKTVRTSDGYALTATEFAPRAPNGSFVIIAPATAVRRSFYDRFARFLAGEGHTVVTFDYRGIGDSRPRRLRGFPARLRDWGELDLVAMIDRVARQANGGPVALVGHSVGGQLLGLAPNADRISTLVAVAAQSGWWGHWSGHRRYTLALLWHAFMPGLTRLVGYFPARLLRLGEDLPPRVALEWARWCRHPDYMIDDEGAPLRPHFDRFAGRALAYSFTDDRFAPRAAVDAMMDLYRRARTDRRHVDPATIGLDRLGHFGFFQERARPRLWAEAALWLRPGGAS